MDLPDLKLHELRGDRSGIWSVKVGGIYRITFQIDAGDIYNVDYEVGFRSYSLKVTPLRSVVIGEVELFQDEPLSVDLRIFPLCPTATNVLFPKVTP